VTVAETLLVFVGAPLAVIVVLALLIFLPAGRSKRPRYKPGQPWDHAPVWYEPHPDHAPAAGHGETLAIGSSVYGERHGGDAHGVTAIGDGAAAPRPAGPLGGARGTW
jgi:hypothetical protein